MRTSLLLSLQLLIIVPCSAQGKEEMAVLGTIDRFFAAMTARDTTAMARTLVRAGNLHIASMDASSPIRTVTNLEYLMRLAKGTERFVERYWDAAVQIDGTVASATMPYDFHVDGNFSHCGVDLFTLVKGPEGWRIACVAYTRQTEGCVPSPLGPFTP
jgi:hypothetical protein